MKHCTVYALFLDKGLGSDFWFSYFLSHDKLKYGHRIVNLRSYNVYLFLNFKIIFKADHRYFRIPVFEKTKNGKNKSQFANCVMFIDTKM